MRRISGLDDIEAGLNALCEMDRRLMKVREAAGETPLRLSEPGFASLVSIIISQQISTASANAILGRFERLVCPMTADNVLLAGESAFRDAGLSRPKQQTLLGAANAVRDGLDLKGLCELEAGEAMRVLTAVRGIGSWTAEIYLLFAAGHPDIFPAKDVALQAAVGQALALEARPDDRQLSLIAESWKPWRGVAARLFWAYYRTIKGRDGAPVA